MAERSSRRDGIRGQRGRKGTKAPASGQDPQTQEQVSLQLIADKLDRLSEDDRKEYLEFFSEIIDDKIEEDEDVQNVFTNMA